MPAARVIRDLPYQALARYGDCTISTDMHTQPVRLSSSAVARVTWLSVSAASFANYVQSFNFLSRLQQHARPAASRYSPYPVGSEAFQMLAVRSVASPGKVVMNQVPP